MKVILDQANGQDLFGRGGFFQQLKQSLANGMLEGELEYHLGYEKHDKSPKTVLSDDDTLNLQSPATVITTSSRS